MEQNRQQNNRPQVQATYQTFTLIDRTNVTRLERMISLVGGGLAILLGLKRSWPGGLLWIASGAFLFYRGVTGFCPAYRVAGVNTVNLVPHQLPGVGSQEEAEVRPTTTIDPTDKVDEQMWETFPASDPPAHY